MPDGTVKQDVVHKDLKSLPGAWVDLRALPFGQMLRRRDSASKMSMETGGKKGAPGKIDIDTLQIVSRQYEFANCIIDHNIDDGRGQKLNFANPQTLDILDPKVGGEIESYIDELNQPSDDLEDFTQSPAESSSPKDLTNESTA